MTSEQYERISKPFRDDKRMLKILLVGNKVETYLFYVLYPLLLVILAATGNPLLVRAVVVPAVAFALVSVFRRFYNAPRPYQELDIDPLIKKDTCGKSFPSRHVFSVYMIAMAWLAFFVPAGVVLLLLGIDMMFIRVVGGVHYPQDVLAGAACGVLAGVLGFYLIP